MQRLRSMHFELVRCTLDSSALTPYYSCISFSSSFLHVLSHPLHVYYLQVSLTELERYPTLTSLQMKYLPQSALQSAACYRSIVCNHAQSLLAIA